MTNILGGLVKKRAELAGEIEQLDQLVEAKVASLRSLDAAILVFDPHYKLETIKPRYYKAADFTRAAFTRRILDIIREATAPISAWDIARTIIFERQGNPEDTHKLHLMWGRITKVLTAQKKSGVLKSEQGANGMVVWAISELLVAD